MYLIDLYYAKNRSICQQLFYKTSTLKNHWDNIKLVNIQLVPRLSWNISEKNFYHNVLQKMLAGPHNFTIFFYGDTKLAW